MTFDYLIIGQGLAGTSMARRLEQAGKSILVIDDGLKSSSSLVAAGMWNPIVFKRLNKSWKADEFLPELESFYAEFEELLGIKILHQLPIDRFFPDLEAAKLWDEKSDLPGFSQYLDQTPDQNIPNKVEAKFGTGRVKGGGYVDLELLVSSYRQHLSQKNSLVEELFDPKLLTLSGDELQYKDYKAKRIIFCTGFRNKENPWFVDLPLRTTKGEVLTLRSKDLPYTSVMNVGRFLLPIGQNQFRLGATYEWHTDDLSITEDARNLLLKKADKLLIGPYEVIDHKAGIRPTVKDRRPLIGSHPEDHRLLLFNGLGTKGVMIAPWLSKHFLNHLHKGRAIDPEVDLNRFF